MAISSECDELVRAKAAAFDGTANDSFETTDEAVAAARRRFTECVATMGAAAAPCLRTMIAAERTDSAFLFAAACLLLDADEGRVSLDAVADAFGRVDLGRVQRTMWVNRVIRLARHDIDTAALAEKYLVFPNVDSPMPTPFMASETRTLGRDYGALFVVGPLPPDRGDEVLERLLRHSEANVRAAAALAAAFEATPACFRALRRETFPNDFSWAIRSEIARALVRAPVTEPEPSPAFSRESVLDALRETAGGHVSRTVGSERFARSANAVLAPEDVGLLREARRRSITSVRNESFEAYAWFTDILYALINRYDLYADARRGA